MLAFFAGLLRAIAATTEEEADTGRWRKSVETARGLMTFTLALPDVLDVLSEDVNSKKMPIPLLQERAHRRLEHLLSEKNFASLEEVNQYLASDVDGFDLHAVTPETPEEQAEELALRAGGESGRAAITLARKALALWPDCADAYIILGEESPDDEVALRYFEQGVAAGERALGKEAFAEYAGAFWIEHETRPYMRARFALAQRLWLIGRRPDAVAHYRELLRLNPDDNQGVRELIVPAMIAIGDDAGAEEVLAQYPDDALSSTLYNRALMAFRRFGDQERARKLLATATECNPHIPAYLLEEIDLPDYLPESFSFGSEDEAATYASDAMEAWQTTPGAFEWLRAHRKDATKGRRKAPRAGAKRPRTTTEKGKTASSGRTPAAKKPKPER
jgi:tetratricopeptide (TPR) repeat protein